MTWIDRIPVPAARKPVRNPTTMLHVVVGVVADHVDAAVVVIAISKRLPRHRAKPTSPTSIGNLIRVTMIWTHQPARHDRRISNQCLNRVHRQTTKMASSVVAHAVHDVAANDKCCRSKTLKAVEPLGHRTPLAPRRRAMTIPLRIDHADARKRADGIAAHAENQLGANRVEAKLLALKRLAAKAHAEIPHATIRLDATVADPTEVHARHAVELKSLSRAPKFAAQKASVAMTTLSSSMTTMQTVSAAACSLKRNQSLMMATNHARDRGDVVAGEAGAVSLAKIVLRSKVLRS